MYVWQDPPHTLYPEHTHPTETAHIILEGEMTLTMDGQTHTFCAGERCDVPAEEVFSQEGRGPGARPRAAPPAPCCGWRLRRAVAGCSQGWR